MRGNRSYRHIGVLAEIGHTIHSTQQINILQTKQQKKKKLNAGNLLLIVDNSNVDISSELSVCAVQLLLSYKAQNTLNKKVA